MILDFLSIYLQLIVAHPQPIAEENFSSGFPVWWKQLCKELRFIHNPRSQRVFGEHWRRKNLHTRNVEGQEDKWNDMEEQNFAFLTRRKWSYQTRVGSFIIFISEALMQWLVLVLSSMYLNKNILVNKLCIIKWHFNTKKAKTYPSVQRLIWQKKYVTKLRLCTLKERISLLFSMKRDQWCEERTVRLVFKHW